MTVHLVGMSDRSGTEELHIPVRAGRRCSYEATLSSAAAHAQAQREDVSARLIPLDEVLGADAPAVEFIKCDVEDTRWRFFEVRSARCGNPCGRC